MKKLLLIPFLIVGFLACKHKADEEVTIPTVETPCDTIVKFKNIVKIMDMYCNNESCHSEAQREGDIALEQYEDIKKHALNGDISRTITLPENDEVFMPQGSDRLSDCEIKQIEIWVKNGAPK